MKEKLILERTSRPLGGNASAGDASLLAFTEKRLREIIRLAPAPKMAIHEWFPQLGLDGTLTLLAL